MGSSYHHISHALLPPTLLQRCYNAANAGCSTQMHSSHDALAASALSLLHHLHLTCTRLVRALHRSALSLRPSGWPRPRRRLAARRSSRGGEAAAVLLLQASPLAPPRERRLQLMCQARRAHYIRELTNVDARKVHRRIAARCFAAHRVESASIAAADEFELTWYGTLVGRAMA